jgi:flagellar hook-length control protein FliK
VLYFDTTPTAAAPPQGAAASPAAPGEAPKSAAAFGDLLSLLTGQPADRTDRKSARRAAAPQDAPAGVPFAPAQTVPRHTARPGAKNTARTGSEAVPTSAGFSNTEAADDQALQDNLAWLIALASAPRPAAAPPSATFPGDAIGDAEKDATACVAPAQSAETGQGAATPTLPGIHLRAARAMAAAAPGTSALEAGSDVHRAQTADEGHAATLDTALRAVGLTVAEQPAAAAPAQRRTGSSPAVSGDQPRAAAAPPSHGTAATVVAPAASAETKAGDGNGSPSRDARAFEERPIESVLSKSLSGAASTTGFELPIDVRVQGGTAAAPASASVVAPARAETALESDLPRQIVQAIRMQWVDGVGDARIKLQPEYLGELSIAIRVEHGSVTASLESNSPTVREWIDSNQPMLRQALSEHGLHLDRLTVTEESARPDWNGNEHPDQKQQQEEARQAQRARRRSDVNAPVFEMTA